MNNLTGGLICINGVSPIHPATRNNPMGDPAASFKNMRGAKHNPPLHAALDIVQRLGLAADTVIVDVKAGLALRVRTRSAASYDDMARMLQQAGFTYAHNHRYMIFVRCAY